MTLLLLGLAIIAVCTPLMVVTTANADEEETGIAYTMWVTLSALLMTLAVCGALLAIIGATQWALAR